MMKIAIIDDEKQWLETIAQYVQGYFSRSKNTIQIFTYTDGESFLRSDQMYELVLIDIEMPRMDGLETAAQYKKQYPQCVLMILTNHMEFSIDGYLVEAFRYIDKSKLEEKLPEALASAQKKLCDKAVVNVLLQGQGLVAMRVDRIVCVEMHNRNPVICTEKNEYRTLETMRKLEQKLKPYHFVRCHHSFIVSLDHIASIQDMQAGEIVLDGGKRVCVSERKRSILKKEYLMRLTEIANT